MQMRRGLCGAQDRTGQTPRERHRGTPACDRRAGYPQPWSRGALARARSGPLARVAASGDGSSPVVRTRCALTSLCNNRVLDSSGAIPHSRVMIPAPQSNRAGLISFLTCSLIVLFTTSVLAAVRTNDCLNDTRGGHWLAQTKGLGVWWCEGGWKVGRERALPAKPRGQLEPVSVSAARGEFEPAQVVLRPEKDCELLWAEV